MEQDNKIKKKERNRWHVPRRNKFDGKPAEKIWQNFVNNNDNDGRVFFDRNKKVIPDGDHGNINYCKQVDNNTIIPRLHFDSNCNNHDDEFTNICSYSSNNDNKPYFIKLNGVTSAREYLRKTNSSPDFDILLDTKKSFDNATKQEKNDDASSISDDTTSISSKSSRSSDSENYRDGEEEKKSSQSDDSNKKSYMVVPKHDIFKKIIIPRYSTIRKGRVFTKQMIRRKLLRERFVALAHHYVGVPYAKKYWKEGTDEHAAPFFLDCCGLVRRILQDMAYDLGFVIGPWNQSYQFDSLPADITFEEMKPGDLIFYRAKFYNPKKSKAQKHDMVHVEIYLGDQNYKYATIGSRQIEAKVAYHDDYRFNSKYYKVYKHHFKSIDAWLDGTLKSYCKNCSWNWNRKPLPRPTMPRVKPGHALTTSQKKKMQRPKSAGVSRKTANRNVLWNRIKIEQMLEKEKKEKKTTCQERENVFTKSLIPVPPPTSIASSAKIEHKSINESKDTIKNDEGNDYEKVQISKINLSKLGLGINVDFSAGIKKQKKSCNINRENGKYHRNSVMNSKPYNSNRKNLRRKSEPSAIHKSVRVHESSEPSFAEFVRNKCNNNNNKYNNMMTSSLATKMKKDKSKFATSSRVNRLSKNMKKKKYGTYHKRTCI